MLAISPAATAAISSVLSAPDVPEGSGLRLWCSDVDEDRVAIQLGVASRPEPEDEILETGAGMDVFVEGETLELLDDKTLDAEFDVDRVVFAIRPQPLNGNRPA